MMAKMVPGMLVGTVVIGLGVVFYNQPAESRFVPTYEAFVPVVEPATPVDWEPDAVAYCRPRVDNSDRIERPNAADVQDPADKFAGACNVWLQYRYVRIKEELVSRGLPAVPAQREAAHKRLEYAYNSANTYLSHHPNRLAEDRWAKLDSPDEILASLRPREVNSKP